MVQYLSIPWHLHIHADSSSLLYFLTCLYSSFPPHKNVLLFHLFLFFFLRLSFSSLLSQPSLRGTKMQLCMERRAPSLQMMPDGCIITTITAFILVLWVSMGKKICCRCWIYGCIRHWEHRLMELKLVQRWLAKVGGPIWAISTACIF